MESESGTHKVSDSGYSNSCSNNSQSQRSSSKSRNSESNSSRSSGYCEHPSTVTSSLEVTSLPTIKRTKDHKKKRQPKIAETILEVVPTECEIPCRPSPTGTIQDIETGVTKPCTEQITKIELVQEDTKWPDVAVADQFNANLAQKTEDLKQFPEVLPIVVSPETISKTACQPEDGFCCVVSMYDGVVFYTTPSITAVLGFPKDMWLGRSFIEFVHQKDQDLFTSIVTNELTNSTNECRSKQKDMRNTMFVNLRKYRGLKTCGYNITDKSVTYHPLHLTITFRKINDQNDPKLNDSNYGVFLIIVAVPVQAIYKVPDESCKLSKFSTRHTASGLISHVDQDVVPNFGYFPHHMIGRCIFDFYHPEDMPLLKDIYEKVMEKSKIPGTLFKSKPYRFLVQNGQYATVETDWTSFINPWTKKIEIVINHHRVIQGPSNPNVFDNPENIIRHIPEEVLKESKVIREEIKSLLNQLVHMDSAKQQIQRCRDLAAFMKTLMVEVSETNVKLDLHQEHNSSISERGSVMLGGISPNHEYCDSKSSSGTPPSYNQLNYNANMQRFFKSKPTTAPYEITGPQSATDTEQEGKSVSAGQEGTERKYSLPDQGSDGSGSGSGGHLSSESNPQMENGTTSATNTSNGSYKHIPLTEALLLKHNEDMEKIMIKRHKEERILNRGERDGKKTHNKHITGLITGDKYANQHHGVKRSGSHSWEDENHKVSKHQHQNEGKDCVNDRTPLLACANMLAGSPTNGCHQMGIDNVNLWPPFSVTLTPFPTTQSSCTTGIVNSNPPAGYPTGMFPAVCYIPAHTGQTPREYPGPPLAGPFQLQYMPSMVYPTMLYPPMAMFQPMPVHVQQPQPLRTPVDTTAKELNHKINKPSISSLAPNICHFQRPSSEAMSVKAEPGSIASASITNQAMSEGSRKALTLQSPASPVVSSQDGETVVEISKEAGVYNTKNFQMPINTREVQTKSECNIEVDEESSYSSFYSSFLKTDTGSGSNEDNLDVKQLKTESEDAKWERPKANPIRKTNPSWLDNVTITPELIYRYQMAVKGIEDILQSDLNTLKDINQPDLVNDQLNQLYMEMELDGLSTRLTLEEGFTSSSSSGEESPSITKRKKKRRSYSHLMMIYEENAPIPPPETEAS